MAFGKLFSKKKKLITYRFEFDLNFETNSVMTIIEDGYIEEINYAWVWDLYYAKTLYTLGNNSFSVGLKNNMEKWAEPLAVGLGFPIEASEDMGLLILDKDLKLSDTSLKTNDQDNYSLEVYQKQSDLPFIQTYQSTTSYQNRFAYSVIALGQYFINKSKYFAKEIPLHILSMRKYFSDMRPFTEIRSTIDAPAFALRESTEMFNELDKEFEQLDKELDEDT